MSLTLRDNNTGKEIELTLDELIYAKQMLTWTFNKVNEDFSEDTKKYMKKVRDVREKLHNFIEEIK